MATATFDGFEIHNGTGDTVVICLGLDCNTVYIVKPFEPIPPNIVVGFSNFWATRLRAGLTWRETATWTSPPQYGSFFGTPANPDYIFGVPPGDPPADPVERGKWVHAWALETRAANPITHDLEQLDPGLAEWKQHQQRVARYFADNPT